jgi:hypothetical protein
VSRAVAVDAVVSGMQVAARRLLRPPTYLIAAVALGVSATSALVERGASSLQAPDRALGVVLRLVLPLVAFALGSLATARQRLDDATWPIARLGAPRAQVALGLMAVTCAVTAVVGVASSMVALVVAYGRLPGLAADLAVSAWIAGLGAAAYVAWFSFGGCFFRRGRGRWFVLVLDFTFGGGAGALAAMWPRAHLRSLAGGEAVLDLSQANSSVLLVAIVAAATILTAMRVGR